jgi:hypothetical protein
MRLYGVKETKPPGTPGKVRSMFVAEWTTREAAEEDRKQWEQVNPMLRYTIEEVEV